MRYSTLADWLGWLEQNHPTEIDLGLARIGQVATRLGLTTPTCSTITVAGTNGKGSCAAVLEKLLLANNRRVGVFTSPHFLHYCERIRVDGEPATEQEVCEAFAKIDAAREDISLTYFEFGALAALEVFQRRGVDVQVLEVGLGGRLDAVNIIDPDIAVITSIAIDHEEWLGSDREVIGREKAGIFRSGRPAICADLSPPASIAAVATEKGTSLLQAGCQWLFEMQEPADQDRPTWTFTGIDHEGGEVVFSNLPLPQLPLPSAAAAVQAMLTLGESIDQVRLHQALGAVSLPGRFQQLRYKERDFVLDVAHNPAAAEYLAERLKETTVEQQTWAVLAMMADKDRPASLSPFRDCISHWLVADLDNPRAAPASALQNDLAGLGMEATCCGDVEEAIGIAVERSSPGDRILILGSFFTVAAAMVLINEVTHG